MCWAHLKDFLVLSYNLIVLFQLLCTSSGLLLLLAFLDLVIYFMMKIWQERPRKAAQIEMYVTEV